MSKQITKPSLVGTSTTDLQFNTLVESTSGSKDLSVSSFSTSKMSENANSGKRYVSTKTYLQQIEDKYDRLDKKQKSKTEKNYRVPSVQSSQFMLKKPDEESHVSNYNHHDIPEKFRNVQTPQPQLTVQPQPKQTAVQLTVPQQQPKSHSLIESRIISTHGKKDAPPPQSESKHAVEFHIPEDLSLSKGVSERGPNIHFKQDVLEDKSKFFELCTKVKQSLPPSHPGQGILIAQMFQEVQQARIPPNQWDQWIRNRLQ